MGELFKFMFWLVLGLIFAILWILLKILGGA
jgi:hypothetical protein